MALNLNRKTSKAPPTNLAPFQGTPESFYSEAREIAGSHNFVYGRPALIGVQADQGTEAKQTSSYTAISLTGQQHLPGSLKRTPPESAGVVWLTARLAPAAPGEVRIRSSLRVEVQQGEYDAAIAEQVQTILDELGKRGWLEKST